MYEAAIYPAIGGASSYSGMAISARPCSTGKPMRSIAATLSRSTGSGNIVKMLTAVSMKTFTMHDMSYEYELYHVIYTTLILKLLKM